MEAAGALDFDNYFSSVYTIVELEAKRWTISRNKFRKGRKFIKSAWKTSNNISKRKLNSSTKLTSKQN